MVMFHDVVFRLCVGIDYYFSGEARKERFMVKMTMGRKCPFLLWIMISLWSPMLT